MPGIYLTSGRAREYCELALNHYLGCPHGCLYCYAASVLHVDKKVFLTPQPRVNLDQLAADAARWRGETRPVLLCFAADPYPKEDEKNGYTRKVIQCLQANGLHFNILTKAGKLAQRDFDLYRPGDAFATTLTCDNLEDSLEWEPGAALPVDRIANLQEAHRRGIETWVSLEPVIHPAQTLNLIDLTHEFVSHFKVGTLNYHPHANLIDWPKFCRLVIRKLDSLDCKYYIKRDLAKTIGQPNGIYNLYPLA